MRYHEVINRLLTESESNPFIAASLKLDYQLLISRGSKALLLILLTNYFVVI